MGGGQLMETGPPLSRETRAADPGSMAADLLGDGGGEVVNADCVQGRVAVVALRLLLGRLEVFVRGKGEMW